MKTTRMRSDPQAELIALAQGKGQILTAPTLRLIRDTLELRGVALYDFVADVRPHFRNNILNPSGFLINRARRFQELSRPAAVLSSSTPVVAARTQVCEVCKGQSYILTEKEIRPCPECSTPAFRKDWEAKEAIRKNRIVSEKAARLKGISECPKTF